MATRVDAGRKNVENNVFCLKIYIRGKDDSSSSNTAAQHNSLRFYKHTIKSIWVQCRDKQRDGWYNFK